ncbi:MAG TPA: prolyl oligopeptidase family serine peptidase [Bacteroidia bacterium]|jgi:prolyl oligopeptidase|nr:prolyl oligopeptidase family serine peptidase [Bacteroidia bacterium]
MQKSVFFFFVATISLSAQTTFTYPVTKKVKQVDEYFGKKIEDPYRWLEDDKSEETKAWVTEQNKVTYSYLEKIPFRDKIKKRLTDMWNYNKETPPFKRGDRFFWYKNNGLQNQSVLYSQKDTCCDKGEILLDPNTLSTDGTSALNSISISKNSQYLAYGISKAGSDWVEIHVMDISKKTDMPDVIKWVKFSGMAWKGNGFYYCRYDEPKTGNALTAKNEYHKLYFHTVGTTQDKDVLVYESKEHPNWNFSAETTHDERFLIIYTSESTSGEMIIVKDLSKGNSEFVHISETFQYDFSVVDNIGSNLFVRTNWLAPKYKLVKIDMNKPEGAYWKDVLGEKADLLEEVTFCNNKILGNYLKDVSSHLYLFSLDGTFEKEIPLPGFCKLNNLTANRPDKFFTYSVVQFTSPAKNYLHIFPKDTSLLIFKPKVDFASDKYTTEQVFYESKDGTKIPMFITHKKDMILNGDNPCFLYAYGGFNISITPAFSASNALFLEAGGIYCVANIRGGGEYGEDWHKSGTKCKKQNVFDDFIAAANYLVANKYTSHQKLAIHGRSNGGLLIGAVMTQEPGIAKVALPTVGVLDMLRFHKFTIGRAWSVDYGNSENKEEFECLIKYSPLHNIKKGDYPATMVLTGDHDDRVVPAHSFKFAATLQENATGSNPTLIRIDVNAGHGAGKPTSKQIDEAGDIWAFVLYNLGVNY